MYLQVTDTNENNVAMKVIAKNQSNLPTFAIYKLCEMLASQKMVSKCFNLYIVDWLQLVFSLRVSQTFYAMNVNAKGGMDPNSFSS